MSFQSCHDLRLHVRTYSADKNLSVSEDDSNLAFSCSNVLQAGSIVRKAYQVSLLGVESLVEQLAHPVGDSEHIGLSILSCPSVQCVIGNLAGLRVRLEAVLDILLSLDQSEQKSAVEGRWPCLGHPWLSTD